jgi:hypothetical protein
MKKTGINFIDNSIIIIIILLGISKSPLMTENEISKMKNCKKNLIDVQEFKNKIFIPNSSKHSKIFFKGEQIREKKNFEENRNFEKYQNEDNRTIESKNLMK